MTCACQLVQYERRSIHHSGLRALGKPVSGERQQSGTGWLPCQVAVMMARSVEAELFIDRMR